jgi:ACS family hexuronate transporter-like MFS transporter
MDRQTISLVKAEVSTEFHLGTNADFGWVLAAFGMTYAIFQIAAGHLVDRWDLRLCYAGAVAWWSAAAIATAFAPNFAMLIVFRCLLGVGESFNWPCALRVTSRILPPGDRSLGNGIFNSGAAVGAVVTPIVVTYLTTRYGWRSGFVAIGIAGFVWVGVWLFAARGKHSALLSAPSNLVSEQKSAAREPQSLDCTSRFAFTAVWVVAIAVACSAPWSGLSSIWLGIAVAMVGPLIVALLRPLDKLRAANWSASLGEVVRNPRFWVLVVVSVSINVCWHFLVNWIPTYLKEERGLSFEGGNYLSTLPFLAADLGNLGGGWLSRRIVSRGWSPVSARRVVMACMSPLIVAGVAVGQVATLESAMLLLSIMAAGTAAFMANYFAFTQEVSRRHTGLVVGYLGGIGNLFVAGFQPFAGAIKDLTGSFSSIFILIGLVPLLGLAALYWAWDDSGADSGDPAVA